MSAIKCDDCGRFMNPADGGTSIAEIFDMVHMVPDRTHFRCYRCTTWLGPVQSNARPADGNMKRYQELVTYNKALEQSDD